MWKRAGIREDEKKERRRRGKKQSEDMSLARVVKRMSSAGFITFSDVVYVSLEFRISGGPRQNRPKRETRGGREIETARSIKDTCMRFWIREGCFVFILLSQSVPSRILEFKIALLSLICFFPSILSWLTSENNKKSRRREFAYRTKSEEQVDDVESWKHFVVVRSFFLLVFASLHLAASELHIQSRNQNWEWRKK